jgi:hypothetical protein
MGQIIGRGTLLYRVIALGIPFVVFFVQILVMYITLPYQLFLLMIGLIVAYMLPPAGKETVIPVGIALGIPWWYMALSIVMVDIGNALFMILNFDIIYKIPYIGKIFVGLTERTQQFIDRYPWITGFYFSGIVLMVMVPVLGSGGIRGSIAGKLLSMGPYLIFLAILTGALIGCFGIALGSEAILTHLCQNSLLPPELSSLVCNRT